jgi:hypothetical protein
MTTPDSRQSLKEYCLRKLGFPVIQINVDDMQLEDAIDDALQKYRMYHYDGTERMFLPHLITTDDINYRYIPTNQNIERIVRVIPLNSTGAVTNMFSFDYQFRLNDMMSLINLPTTNYVVTQQYLQLLQDIFVGEVNFQHNRNTGRLFLTINWGEEIHAGDWIVTECHVVVDPETSTKVYDDSWLKQYTTQLFKKQWANNMKKFGNLELPGGIVLNGQTLYDEADKELEALETQLKEEYQPPPMFFVG